MSSWMWIGQDYSSAAGVHAGTVLPGQQAPEEFSGRWAHRVMERYKMCNTVALAINMLEQL